MAQRPKKSQTPARKRPREVDPEVLERFREYLVKKGMKYTQPREQILRTFFMMEGHVSADELFDAMRERDEGVGFATVHRTLKLFVEAGFAEEHHFGGRQRRYEASRHDEHHDHLICTECGLIVEFEEERIEALQEEVAARYGFVIRDHRLELFGHCEGCREAE